MMIHDISSYINLLIYILLWAVTTYCYYKKVGFTSGLLIILSYFLYGIFALFLFNDDFHGRSYKELSLFPFIYLFLMLLIFLIPVIKYEKAKVAYIKTPSKFIIYVFLFIYGICSIVILPNTIGSLQEGLTILLLDQSGGMDLYQSTHDNYSLRQSGISGVYGLCSIIHGIFSDIALFVFSYYLTFKDKNKYLLLFLAVVVISDLLYPLSKGERTGVIMKLYSVLMAISLFYPFYSSTLRNRVKKSFLFLCLIISLPFMALTISRFADSSYGTKSSMLLYVAQAPLNFNNHALNNGGIRNGDRTINLIKQFCFEDVPRDVDEVRFKYSHHKMNDSVFSTFVGDFALDYGPVGAFSIFVFLSIYFYMKIKIFKRTTSFQTLLLVYFLLCVAMQGGMYLFNYAFMGNLSIMAFIFFSVVLSIDAHVNRSSQMLIKQ